MAGQTITDEGCHIQFQGAPGCADLTLTVAHNDPGVDVDLTNNTRIRTIKFDVNK